MSIQNVFLFSCETHKCHLAQLRVLFKKYIYKKRKRVNELSGDNKENRDKLVDVEKFASWYYTTRREEV